MQCCICGGACILEERYAGAPHSLMSVYHTDHLQKRDLDLYCCAFCGHMQIPASISEEYYQDYSMGSFWGASFRQVRERQLERLAQMAPAKERFLDIGCGVGHYLGLARRHFAELVGVEPSLSSAEAARQSGFTVIHDYFHEGLQWDAQFDAITMVEVLEHVERPAELFAQAARLLKDGGILLVEVPNGRRIAEERLYYNLCTDHIQYFSAASLAAMAQRAGLTVLCTQESEDPNLLELYAKKKPKPAESFTERRQGAFDRLAAQLSSDAGAGGKVAAWGAGAEAACFLGMLEEKVAIDCLFDSDQGKVGRAIAGIPIVKPTAETVGRYAVIVLFANAHKRQSREQLEQLGFAGELLTFE